MSFTHRGFIIKNAWDIKLQIQCNLESVKDASGLPILMYWNMWPGTCSLFQVLIIVHDMKTLSSVSTVR